MGEKRARRRKDLHRMKAKPARIGLEHGMPGNWRKLYDHLAVCSLYCCGNPRKWFGEFTTQERRFLAEEVDP